MTVKIEKAEAFVIEPGKQYVATYESSEPISQEEADNTQKQIQAMFEAAGAKVIAAVIVKGHLSVTEVKE